MDIGRRLPLSVAGRVWIAAVGVLFIAFTAAGLHTFSWRSVAMIALCFSCELMDSSLGMGYGTTLTPVLLAAGYRPLDLVPTILVSELLSGFAATFFHSQAGNVAIAYRSRHLAVAAILTGGSLAGVYAGVKLAVTVSGLTLRIVIGSVILAAGLCVWALGDRTLEYRHWKLSLLSGIASFNKAVSGGGYGPLMTSGQVLSGVESKAAVAITSCAEGFTCLAGTLLFLAEGKGLTPGLLIPVAAGALLSVPFSAAIVSRVTERRLRRAVAALTVGLGAFTLFKALA